MRWSFFIIVLFASLSSFGAIKALPFPEKGFYLESSKDVAPNLRSVDSFFSMNRYVRLKSKGDPRAAGLHWLDRIYVTRKTNQSIMVKSRIKIQGEMEPGKIYRHKHGLLVHLPEDKETVTAFFFMGYSVNAVQDLSHQLKSRLNTSHFPSVMDLLLPRAHAITLEDLGLPCGSSEASPQPAADPDLLSVTWGCMQGVGAGALDATVEVLPTIWNGIQATASGVYWMATSNPQQKWEFMVDQKKKMETIVAKFPELFGEMVAGFNSLPNDIKAQVICETISAIGLPVLFSMLTGGAAMPAVGVRLASTVQRVAARLGNSKLTRFSNDLFEFEVRQEKKFHVDRVSSFTGGKRLVVIMDDVEKLVKDAYDAEVATRTHLNNKSLATDIKAWEEELKQLQEKAVKLKITAMQGRRALEKELNDFWAQNEAAVRLEELKNIFAAKIYGLAFLCNLGADVANTIDATQTIQ